MSDSTVRVTPDNEIELHWPDDGITYGMDLDQAEDLVDMMGDAIDIIKERIMM